MGDQRLNKRAVLLAERLAEKPTASIPSACGGWAETAAAYRFLAQDELDWRDILAPHWRSSAERMRACEVVLGRSGGGHQDVDAAKSCHRFVHRARDLGDIGVPTILSR